MGKNNILTKLGFMVFFCCFMGGLSLFAQPYQNNEKYIVVIDAGHGGKDPGAIGKYSKEKNINLSVALALGKLIEKNLRQTEVVYTRKTDVFIPLDRRAQIANKAHADLFISSHTNALPKKKIARGTETYTLGMARADENLEVAKRENAVILVLVYMFLPYAILPVFTSIDKFDFSLLEAAQDLGAGKFQALRKVMLPNIRPGITTAVIFTFIPIFGTYTVPLFVGGQDSYLIGNVIVDQATKIGNWPLAAAVSMVITVISTAAILLMMYTGPREGKNPAGKETA